MIKMIKRTEEEKQPKSVSKIVCAKSNISLISLNKNKL